MMLTCWRIPAGPSSSGTDWQRWGSSSHGCGSGFNKTCSHSRGYQYSFVRSLSSHDSRLYGCSKTLRAYR